MKTSRLLLLPPVLACVLVLACVRSAAAELVDYDAGTRTIDGVQLVQDAENPLAFYYLPQYPRLARQPNGDFELLLLRTIGADAASSGGIFHALVEFSLPDETLQTVAAKLAHDVPGAQLRGALKLLPLEQDGASSFTVVSATLQPGPQAPDRVEGSVITSGVAPLDVGSKAVVAARLSGEQAALMWATLTQPGVISDVSVSVRAYYEAKVKGYNAVISADAKTVYNHQSLESNQAQGFTRNELRRISDQLIQDQTIKVEVFDRGAGTSIKTDDMAKITDLVTDKLIEVLFDTRTGWSRAPDREVAVAANQVLGRQERGFFSKVFGGTEDTPYYTDSQYVRKRIEDVRANKISINLAKTTVVRVPWNSAGNLGGIYGAVPAAERGKYFKVQAQAEDPLVQHQDLVLQIDGSVIDGFASVFNNVAVNLRQRRQGSPASLPSVVFDADGVRKGQGMKTVQLQRLGDATESWRDFEYQVIWSLRGVQDPIREPASPTQWKASHDPAITLAPGVERRELALEAATSEFAGAGIRLCEVQVLGVIGGKAKLLASRILRAGDAAPPTTVAVYGDSDKPMASAVFWSSRYGRATQGPTLIEGQVVSLATPSEEWLRGNSR
jgi:hypothetical protein